MITFPTTIEEAVAATGEVRAGGTDLQERRRHRISTGDLVDLRDVKGLDSFEWVAGGGLKIGAKTRIATVAGQAEVHKFYPGLAEAAGGLATPQIRAVGTIGGNLLQRTRCWYYRSPDANCLKKGGAECYARKGDHLYHSCFDLGPCVAVHASSLGMVLLAYDANVEVAGGAAAQRTVAELYGDGADPRTDHELEEGALLTAVVLPKPTAGEQSAYFRAISRARSEWPLVEVLARVVVNGGTIRSAAIALGGVAPIPLRAAEAEKALVGKAPDPDTLAAAAKAAADGAAPLPMTGYKVDLIEGTVLETLERALDREPVKPAPRSKLPKR